MGDKLNLSLVFGTIFLTPFLKSHYFILTNQTILVNSTSRSKDNEL